MKKLFITILGLLILCQPVFADTKAKRISVDASGFSGNLSPSDTDVQKALETVDGISITAGEVNTASNEGAGGVGIFKQKAGVNLEFKNINAGSNKVSIIDDAGNNEVDIDVNESNLTLSNIGGSVTDAQVPNNITIDNASTADALSSNPSDCSSNQFANAIDPNGNLSCSALSDADIPDSITASSYLPLSGGVLTNTLTIDRGSSGDVLVLDSVLSLGQYQSIAFRNQGSSRGSIDHIFSESASYDIAINGFYGVKNEGLRVKHDGSLVFAGTPSCPGGLETDSGGVVSCHTDQVLDLSGTETITGDWVNTVNPWSDNEVADDITVSNYLPLTGGTMTGQIVTDNLGVEFEDSDTNPACVAGNFNIFADLNEAKLKKCEDGSVTDLDTTGGTPSFSTLSGGTNTTSAMIVGTGSSLETSGSGTITATSLSSNGSNCTVTGEFPKGIDSAGNAEACTGIDIDHLTDVVLTSAASGQILVINAALTAFENRTVSGDATISPTGIIDVTQADNSDDVTCVGCISDSELFTDFIAESEMDTESELEGQITDMTNIIQESEIDTSSELASILTDEVGTDGGFVRSISPTLTTPTISGNINFPDGIRQTFNPDSNVSGLNAGSQAGDPSSVVDGDIWYNSTLNKLRCRENGSTKNCINGEEGTIQFWIDGGGSAISSGSKAWIRSAYDFIITDVEMTADQSGSIVIDIWKDSYANFPPDNADSICASSCPSLVSQQKSQDSTLSGWSTAVSKGDYIKINVDSSAAVQQVLITLNGVKQ